MTPETVRNGTYPVLLLMLMEDVAAVTCVRSSSGPLGKLSSVHIWDKIQAAFHGTEGVHTPCEAIGSSSVSFCREVVSKSMDVSSFESSLDKSPPRRPVGLNEFNVVVSVGVSPSVWTARRHFSFSIFDQSIANAPVFTSVFS